MKLGSVGEDILPSSILILILENSFQINVYQIGTFCGL